MVDIPRQVAHWRKGAEEDWTAATVLVERGHVRHGVFFAHLALEKALKAHVCSRTGDLAPRTHNLIRLAALAGIELSPERLDLLADISRFNMVGRYPDMGGSPAMPKTAAETFSRAAEVLQWLMKQL